MQRALSDGLTFIPPYDHPHVISGQGTIGMEILRQVGHCLACCHAAAWGRSV